MSLTESLFLTTVNMFIDIKQTGTDRPMAGLMLSAKYLKEGFGRRWRIA